MPLLKPDPTFYPSPTFATQSPPEKLAYVALINPGTHRQQRRDRRRGRRPGVEELRPSGRSDRHAAHRR